MVSCIVEEISITALKKQNKPEQESLSLNFSVIIDISEPKPQNSIHSLIITSNNTTHVKLKIARGNCIKLVALKSLHHLNSQA